MHFTNNVSGQSEYRKLKIAAQPQKTKIALEVNALHTPQFVINCSKQKAYSTHLHFVQPIRKRFPPFFYFFGKFANKET